MPTNLRATYRVQLHAGFNFDQAVTIIPYLRNLGLSHLYTSPYLQAAPGSTHGYNVVDHTQVNRELGGKDGLSRLNVALQEYEMGQVLDIVPNHMAITGLENPWWMDVLENGPSSRYASYFDVEWDPVISRPTNKVLVPVLGNHYGRVLEAGELQLDYREGRFFIRYYDKDFPVDPCTVSIILSRAAEIAGSPDLAYLADSYERLPVATAFDRVLSRQRHRDKEVLHSLLLRLAEQPVVEKAIEQAVAEINADVDALDRLILEQNYRLAYWRVTQHELSYRRFFDVDTLIGLRTEDEEVFLDTHALVIGWLMAGYLDGLRIDHPDGLRDPLEYFVRLQRARPSTWLIVEKILEAGEPLRSEWPVAGTVGYDFLNRVNGLFVDPRAEEVLTRFYAEFTGEEADFEKVVYASKHQVLQQVLGSDVNRLTDLLMAIVLQHRRHRDYTRNQLRQALQEIAACFPVYRTYVRAETGEVSPLDQQYIDQAVEEAKSRRTDLEGELFDFIRDLLLLRLTGELEGEFAMRFQQFTGPAMAKGVEDTAFYNYNRFVSLNEVGGSPGRFGLSLNSFYQSCIDTLTNWPKTMLATSTHDTKRSEDIRARLNVLSEMPSEWTQAVSRWSEMGQRYKKSDLPDRNTEYLLYQTLVGAWPIEEERVQAYMEKAIREAKKHTSWTTPNSDYESAVADFIRGVMNDPQFLADLEQFVAGLVEAGWINSLSQSLLKLTCPGIPDIYQGTELWDFSLVDPDNRRPVDYSLRRELFDSLRAGMPVEEIWRRAAEGLPKLWVIRQTLALRESQPEWFGADSGFTPLTASNDCVVAFARGGMLVIAPRLVHDNRENWGQTLIHIPEGRWMNILTQQPVESGPVPLSRLLVSFPVSLLVRENSG